MVCVLENTFPSLSLNNDLLFRALVLRFSRFTRNMTSEILSSRATTSKFPTGAKWVIPSANIPTGSSHTGVLVSYFAYFYLGILFTSLNLKTRNCVVFFQLLDLGFKLLATYSKYLTICFRVCLPIRRMSEYL